MRQLNGMPFRILATFTISMAFTTSAVTADKAEESNRIKQARVLFKAHQYKWNKNRPKHYTFTATYSVAGVSEKPTLWFGNQIQVFVTGNKPVLVRNLTKKRELRTWPDDMPTIDSLFELIEKELGKKPKEFRIAYNLQHSVPSWVEFGSVAQDSGFQYTVTDYRPLSDEEMAKHLKAK